MKNLFIYYLLICFVGIAKCQTIAEMLTFDGGHCEICNDGLENYACSNGLGNWNDGKLFFQNTIPDNHTLTGVNATLYGVWGCDGSQTELQIMLENNLIGQQSPNGQCDCGTCDSPISVNNGVFPNYKYGDNYNRIQVLVNSGLACLSKVELVLTYEPGDQNQTLPSDECLEDCGMHGECGFDESISDYRCLCDEDWHGPECDCFIESLHLQTDNPPVLDSERSGFNAQDMLHLYVNNSVKYFDTEIRLRNYQGAFCDFDKVSDGLIWEKAYDPMTCTYTYFAVMPWELPFTNCFFTKIEDNDTVIMTGELLVTNKEDLGYFSEIRNDRLIRTIRSTLPFQIVFPKNIHVSSDNVTVFAELQIFAAIIEQSFEVTGTLPGEGTIKLLTSVQHPFQLTAPFDITGPDGYSLSIDGPWEDGGAACLDDGNPCEQVWTIIILPDTDKCNLNGDYQATFNITCKDPNNCAVDDSTDDVVIDFSLESEDFCPTIIDEVDLSGAMDIYADPQHTTIKNIFFMGDTMYFKIVLLSDKTTITKSMLESFSFMLLDDTMIILFDNGANTQSGDNVNLQVFDDAAPNEIHVEMTIDASVFNVPEDQCLSLHFWADVEVEFVEDLKRTIGKRNTNSANMRVTSTPCVSSRVGTDGSSDGADGSNNDGSNDESMNDDDDSTTSCGNNLLNYLTYLQV